MSPEYCGGAGLGAGVVGAVGAVRVEDRMRANIVRGNDNEKAGIDLFGIFSY